MDPKPVTKEATTAEPEMPEPKAEASKAAWISWAALALPLIWLWIVALGYQHREAPAAAALESTYLMQAESLLHDGDLAYTQTDYERHYLERYGAPTDLHLATGSEGRKITFDRPLFYALWTAPFLALRPNTGFAFGNVLLLTLCLVWAVRRLGPESAAGLALLVFTSAAFAHVFFAAGDLFLFCLSLTAFVLISSPVQDTSTNRDGGAPTPRLVFVGAILLALVVTTEPVTWPLLLIYLFALPRVDGLNLRTAALMGCFIGFFVLGVLFWWNGGGLGFFGTSRMRFTPETGFPLVDFAAPQWRTQVAQLSALHWEGALKLDWGFDLRLWAWNVVNLWLGQSFGLLPYFLPVFTLLLLSKGNAAGRRAWLLGVAVWMLVLLVFRPFDLSGGESTVGNRLFLPFAAASVVAWGGAWRRLPKLPTLPVAFVFLTVLGAPFLGRLWLAPGAYPVQPGEGYRYPTSVAKALLPYEISQRPMPGGLLVDHLGIRVRLMDRGLGEEFTDMLSFAEARPAKLWIASTEPLRYLQLAMDDQAPSEILVGGAEVVETLLLSDGGIAFRLEPELFRRHNMWWSPNSQYIYRLGFQLPEPQDRRIRFRLVAETDADLEPLEEDP